MIALGQPTAVSKHTKAREPLGQLLRRFSSSEATAQPALKIRPIVRMIPPYGIIPLENQLSIRWYVS